MSWTYYIGLLIFITLSVYFGFIEAGTAVILTVFVALFWGVTRVGLKIINKFLDKITDDVIFSFMKKSGFKESLVIMADEMLKNHVKVFFGENRMHKIMKQVEFEPEEKPN